ncbi:MAG: four helix bundle protein [Candidatus Aureabacteria bacterium]|nr:four helix bundle protein [Candidatus Auribacterota bacterium]
MNTDGEQEYIFDFEKLDVYQRALQFAAEIITIVKRLEPHLKFTIGSNLIRAAMSVANNIAEGSGKRSAGDKARYYGYSLASTRECVPSIAILFMEKQISIKERDSLRGECVALGSMVGGLIRKA